MSARHDEHGRRQRQLAVRERERLDVPGQVMHRYDGNTPRPGKRFRERHADEEGPDQPGTLGHGHGIDVARLGARLRQGRLDDAADVAHVLAGRQLGNDAPPLTMNVGLRCDDGRPDGPRACGIARFGDERRGGFVARGLDREQIHFDGAMMSKAPFSVSL